MIDAICDVSKHRSDEPVYNENRIGDLRTVHSSAYHNISEALNVIAQEQKIKHERV